MIKYYYIQVILGSVLSMIRFIFSLCRYNTMIVRNKIIINNNVSFKKSVIIVATTPVTIDARETYLNKYNTSRKVIKIAINKNGLTPRITPPDVATAFPPLNLAKRG